MIPSSPGPGSREARGAAVIPEVLRRAIVACLAAMALYAAGALEFMERPLLELRFALAPSDPSGEILLVAIDRESLDEIGVWPWPRRLHALVLARLEAAGAAEIFFDIDFSARSTEADDATFARALERSGAPVRLAAFRDPDLETDVEPIAAFRAHAEATAVEMPAESDGRIWRAAPQQQMARGVARSMFAAMAGLDGGGEPWWIDYGMDPGGIPLLSFADVAAGRFDPESARGRRVIVGAVAVELGDIVPTPRFGLLPGPVVQIIAAEGAASGRRLARAAPALVALLCAAAALAAAAGLARPTGLRVLISLSLSCGGAFALALTAQRAAPILMDVAPAFVAALLAAPLAYAGRAAQLDLKVIARTLALGRANRFAARVADHLDDGLATFAPDGSVRTLNQAARDMFALGAAPEERIAPEALILRPRLADRSAFLFVLSAAESGARRRLICARADGSRFHAEASVTGIEEPEGRVRILLLRDVTETVRREREARRREAQLRALKVRAEAATRTKTEFVAAMSHELRTPLNAIIGFSSLMQEEAFGPLGAPAYRDMAGETGRSGARLLRLLTHILDYANAEMDRLEIAPAPSDLAALAKEAAALQAGRAAQAGVTVSLSAPDEPLILPIDRIGAQKAVGNVLANAIRFSPEGGEIAIAVERRPAGGAVVIRDRGAGMAPDFLRRCCDPFEQEETGAARSFEGAGLGLTVARAFAMRHGGALDIASAPGEGTEVTIFFPAEAGGMVGPEVLPRPFRINLLRWRRGKNRALIRNGNPGLWRTESTPPRSDTPRAVQRKSPLRHGPPPPPITGAATPSRR